MEEEHMGENFFS